VPGDAVLNDVRPAAGVAPFGVAAALAFTGLFTVMNLAYVPLIAAGRAWRGVDDYLATWHWTEFGPQAVGLVALPVFAVLLVTLYRAAPSDRATFSLAGLLFGFAFVAVVWVGYVVQVAWLWPNLRAGVDTGVELLAFRNARSVGWALNHAGWSLSGAAALALSGMFRGDRLQRRLRALLVFYGGANLLLLPSYGFGVELLSVPAVVSWLVVLPVAALHIAAWFHRLDRQAPRSRPPRGQVGSATRAGQQA
jgi:hypothetical protein